MPDGERPPRYNRTGDGAEPDSAGAMDDVLGAALAEDADEWTEPVERAGTDPFQPRARAALEPPAERARSARRGHRPGWPRAGVVTGRDGRARTTRVAVAVGFAAWLAFPAVTDGPRESADALPDARRSPISELAEQDAAALSPFVPSPPAEAERAVCELDPLAPAPALPAAAPARTRRVPATRAESREAGEASEDADSAASTESRSASLPEDERRAGEPNADADADADAEELLLIPGNQAPVP